MALSMDLLHPKLPPQRAVFFDRDGVVNLSPGAGYVLRPEDLILSPGISTLLAWCRHSGYKLILVTSQQGVGKGLMDLKTLDRIHDTMQDKLAGHNAQFDAIYACTHLEGTCPCRKPSPWMVHKAAREWNLNLTASALVGDHDRDIQMAHNSGVGWAVRLTGENPVTVPADVTCATLAEVSAALRAWHSRTTVS